MLALIDKGIWTYQQELKLLGFPLGTRMTVIEVSEGELLLVSPVKMTDSALRQVGEAGNVKWIIAPNPFHHIYLNSAVRGFPDAITFAPRSLIIKRQDFNFQGVIEKQSEFPWKGAVEYHLYEPSAKYSEVLLFHPLSQTLIVTDFIFNLKEPHGTFHKVLGKVLNLTGKPSFSLLSGLMVKDRKDVKEAVAQIEKWNPKRLIMAHGELFEGDVVSLVKDATKRFLS